LSGVTLGLPAQLTSEALSGLAAYWLGLAALGPIARWAATPSPLFLPVAWLTAAIWLVALVGDPPIAAIIAGVLALAVAAPLLTPATGGERNAGVLFYVVIGLALVLIANWQAQWSVAEPLVVEHALAATLALGLGCMLLLGAFPFRIWSSALFPDSDPARVALVALVLQPAALLMVSALAQDLGWLRAPLGVTGLRVAGILSLLAAGVLAFGEARLERLLGHALLFDVGAALLGLANGTPLDRGLIVASIAVRTLGVIVWANGLATLRSGRAEGSLSLDGIGLRLPLATAAFLVGPLTIVGYPLLAGFPLRWALLVEHSPQDLTAVLALVAGLAGLGFATFRSLTQLITPAEGAATLRFEDRGWPALVALIALMAILLSASFPQVWFWLFPVAVL
jgi:formate hydrogenlyase subunit 3/multisubunit Na+/H+ antiporter MnhD subunit